MKNLLLVLLFVPLVSFGQTYTDPNSPQPVKVEVNTTIKTEKSYSEKLNETRNAAANAKRAQAAAVNAAANRAAAMSRPTKEIKTPLTVDLYKYTHIALVDVTYANASRQSANSRTYNDMANSLGNSPLSIINPRDYDKKKFKKNMRFLRDIKNPSWLYLYYRKSIQGIDDIRILVIRDSNNRVIYNVTATNVPFDEVTSVITQM